MIISENSKPTLCEFQRLMRNTDALLNNDAQKRESYYANRGGHLLECDVCDAISECAKGTAFDGTIQLVSGASFPDIVANKYYGVEVKSTNKNHWTSIGSSILESTRIQDVERIFLTFGKLGHPVEFLSRPYEACLSGIAVTHYPRYQIDMRLAEGETIFDRMGIPYDQLRNMDNPVAPVSAYYKSKLKPGERLWWAGDDVEAAAPATLRLWSNVAKTEKERLTAQGYALFPELLADGHSVRNKYDNFALWLVADYGIVNNHLRDGFSAGGQVELPTLTMQMVRMPATFGRINQYRSLIVQTIMNTPETVLEEYWNEPVRQDRVRQWCSLAASAAASCVPRTQALSVLYCIFGIQL